MGVFVPQSQELAFQEFVFVNHESGTWYIRIRSCVGRVHNRACGIQSSARESCAELENAVLVDRGGGIYRSFLQASPLCQITRKVTNFACPLPGQECNMDRGLEKGTLLTVILNSNCHCFLLAICHLRSYAKQPKTIGNADSR